MTKRPGPKVALFVATLTAIAGCDSGGGASPLEAPALRGPADNADFPARSIVEFSWSRVEGAVAYEYAIEYDHYPYANNSVVVVDSLHVEQLTELGAVRWRVRGRSADAPGPWSAVRRMEVYGTPSPLASDFRFPFTTEGVAVGDPITVDAGRAFSADLLAAIQTAGAEPADLREIVVSGFRLSISSPAGTTLDQFSEWRLHLRRGAAASPILALPDPAPALESADMAFQQPEDLLNLATHPETRLELSVAVNTRSPRSTDVDVDVYLEMTVILNR